MKQKKPTRKKMKPSHSVLDFQECIRSTCLTSLDEDLFSSAVIDNHDDDSSPFSFKNREMMITNAFPSIYYADDDLETLTVFSPNSNVNTPNNIDCQSSITDWATNTKHSEQDRRGGSSPDQTDDDDNDAPLSHQTPHDPIQIKRMRRMVSNRESARRSRKRKLQYKQELESEVERLKVDNESLLKQFTQAIHHHRSANTNNRVLKSDVEALRAKVKLAEDIVARGALTCELNQLLHTHLTPQPINHHHMNVSPTIAVHHTPYPANAPVSGLASSDINNNGVHSDAVSCISDYLA